jgi:hypothetical protein
MGSVVFFAGGFAFGFEFRAQYLLVFWNRIVSAFEQRIASKQSKNRQKRRVEEVVVLVGFDRVTGAGGVIPTTGTASRKGCLVPLNHLDCELFHRITISIVANPDRVCNRIVPARFR